MDDARHNIRSFFGIIKKNTFAVMVRVGELI